MLLVAAFASPIVCSLGALAPTLRLAHGDPGASGARSPSRSACCVAHRRRRGDAQELPGLRHQPARAGHRPRGRRRRDRRCPWPTSAPWGWRLIYVVALVFLVVAVRPAPAACPRAGASRSPHAASPTLPRRRFALIAATGLLVNLLDRAGLVLPEPLPEGRPRLLGHARSRCSPWSPTPRAASASWPAAASPTSTGGASSAPSPRWVAPIVHRHHVLRGGRADVARQRWSAPSSAAPAIPALGVYTVELFPTGRRGLANGLHRGHAPRRLEHRAPRGREPARRRRRPTAPVMALLAIGPLAGRRPRRRLVPRDRPPRAGADQPRGPAADGARRERRRWRPSAHATGGTPATADATRGVGALAGRGDRPRSTRAHRPRDGLGGGPSSSSGVPNGSLVPWTNSVGTVDGREVRDAELVGLARAGAAGS